MPMRFSSSISRSARARSGPRYSFLCTKSILRWRRPPSLRNQRRFGLARKSCKAAGRNLARSITGNANYADPRGPTHQSLKDGQIVSSQIGNTDHGSSPRLGAEALCPRVGAGSARTAYLRLKERAREAAWECSKYRISARCQHVRGCGGAAACNLRALSAERIIFVIDTR